MELVHRRRAVCAAGAVVTCIAALSVHVVMLQVLHVPFPDRSAVPVWAALLNSALPVFGLMVFYDLARLQLAGCNIWVRWLVVAAVFGMLKEAFRGQIMNGVVSTAWVFSAAHVLSPVVYSLVLGGLVVAVAPLVRGVWLPAAAVGVALVMAFVVKPLSGMVLAPVMASVAHLDHADVYPFPYGVHVLFWAYVTYLEPAVACIVAAALVWPALGVVRFAGVVMLIKGALLPTFLFSLFNAAGFATGMLSESQFLLEALVLSLCAAVTWRQAA